MITFKTYFNKIMEDCVSGGVDSVFTTGDIQAGSHGNQFPSQNDLAYAPGDARFPYFIGSNKKKRKKKVKVQRRPLIENKKVSDFKSYPIGALVQVINPHYPNSFNKMGIIVSNGNLKGDLFENNPLYYINIDGKKLGFTHKSLRLIEDKGTQKQVDLSNI